MTAEKKGAAPRMKCDWCSRPNAGLRLMGGRGWLYLHGPCRADVLYFRKHPPKVPA